MSENSRNLTIVWTNAHPDVFNQMIFFYAGNSLKNNWWDKVTVVLWGPTQSVAVENEVVRRHIKTLQEAGINFSACLVCADERGLTEELRAMDIEVVRWGARLTELLHNDEKVLTI